MIARQWLAGFILVLLAPIQALAWSGPAHAAVAAMAFRELAADPALRKNLTDLLKNHPRFSAWESEFNAKKSTFPSSLDFGMFLFIRAATWPDEIRRTADPKLKPFDHPDWHFVDYPLRPPEFTTGPSPFPNDDVLFGIRKSLETLANKDAKAVERAAALSWLIHLVGDIHQPLHCATLITATFKAPLGDRGGNGFIFFQNAEHKKRQLKTKLHSYWDGRLFGTSDGPPPPAQALQNAKSLEAKHSRADLGELSAGGNAEQWSFESRDEAAGNAYRFRGKELGQEKVLPSGYITNSHKVAGRRLALAGYRLADELHKVGF
ncbi:MAG TPA: S1/P1 nuclease [Thermoanaerobaculia bacterium]|jgi:hypothetical protein|nr:S1/P1 nuclease [Thermoanaerobaculia bacterium]